MNHPPDDLNGRMFDVAIIGGGILGAGIARDAALRGLSVALVEQNDFASGTSSASTKLIHGGLRYLEQFAFLLVAESCRERRILLDMAPHLVRPLPLIMPAYRGDPHSLFQLRLGTTIYDWMTLSRHPRMPRHTTLTAAQAVEREPALPLHNEHGDPLQGAVLVYDCQMDDARLCLETILDAARHGAVCRNYCRAEAFQFQEDRLAGVTVRDRFTGDESELRARVFINATGPWAESVSAMNGRSPGIRLSPTKGVHLVLPQIVQQHGIYFQSRGDGRMIFLLPWDDASLLGTTDTDFRKDPSLARAEPEDVAYLIEQLNAIMPEVSVEQRDIITAFAGVRALVRSDSRRPSSRSREEKIIPQGTSLLHVAGGKYTTFRAVAEKVLKQVGRMLQRRLPPCRTDRTPLPDSRPTASGRRLSSAPPVFESDIRFACRQEQARTLTDVMRRRTRLALSAAGGADTAGHVADIMAEELHWTDDQRQKQMDDYLRQRSG